MLYDMLAGSTMSTFSSQSRLPDRLCVFLYLSPPFSSFHWENSIHYSPSVSWRYSWRSRLCDLRLSQGR